MPIDNTTPYYRCRCPHPHSAIFPLHYLWREDHTQARVLLEACQALEEDEFNEFTPSGHIDDQVFCL